MITSEMPPAGPSSAAARGPALPDAGSNQADASFATVLGAPQAAPAARPVPIAINRPAAALTEPTLTEPTLTETTLTETTQQDTDTASPEPWAAWLAQPDAAPEVLAGTEIVAPQAAQMLPEISIEGPPSEEMAEATFAQPEPAALSGPVQTPVPSPAAQGVVPKGPEQIDAQEVAPPDPASIPQPAATDWVEPDAPGTDTVPAVGLPLVEASARAEVQVQGAGLPASAPSPAPPLAPAAPAVAAATAAVRAALDAPRNGGAVRVSEDPAAPAEVSDTPQATAPAASERASTAPAPVPAPIHAQPTIPTAPLQMAPVQIALGKASAAEPEPASTDAEATPVSSPAATASTPTTATPVQTPFAAADPRGLTQIAGDGVTLAPSDAPAWRLSARDGAAAVERALQAAAAAPRDVTGQITLAVTNAAQPEIELRLDPPELGRVQLRLNPTEGGGIHAIVMSERPETQDFLRRHADALVRDLNAAGYTQVTLGFTTGGDAQAQSRSDTRGERRYAGAFDPATTGATAATTPEAPRRRSADSLDIRL